MSGEDSIPETQSQHSKMIIFSWWKLCEDACTVVMMNIYYDSESVEEAETSAPPGVGNSDDR